MIIGINSGPRMRRGGIAGGLGFDAWGSVPVLSLRFPTSLPSSALEAPRLWFVSLVTCFPHQFRMLILLIPGLLRHLRNDYTTGKAERQ